MLIIRPIIKKDRDVLQLATYYNLNWNEERFTLEEVDSNTKFKQYFDSWKASDFGFVAQRHQQIFGVVWLKFFSEDKPGFGFWDEETPELILSVFPEYRNSGFGKRLLKFAIEEAERREIPSISLSVEFGNEIAIKLYEKFGFRYLDGTDGTMLLNLL